jgi:hypothetical protein
MRILQLVFTTQDLRPSRKYCIKIPKKPKVQEMMLKTQRWNEGPERVQNFMTRAQKDEKRNADPVRKVTDEIQSV